jgi:hypothetical protein
MVEHSMIILIELKYIVSLPFDWTRTHHYQYKKMYNKKTLTFTFHNYWGAFVLDPSL